MEKEHFGLSTLLHGSPQPLPANAVYVPSNRPRHFSFTTVVSSRCGLVTGLRAEQPRNCVIPAGATHIYFEAPIPAGHRELFPQG